MKKLNVLFAGMFALAMVAPLRAADGDNPPAPPGDKPAPSDADKPAAAREKKPGRGERGAKGERPAKTLRDLDKNANRQIDGDEVDALKKHFEAAPKGPFARFDKNADSKLDDDEVKAINQMMAKRGQGKAPGGRRKKNL